MYTYKRRRGFEFDNFEITKREILASISIIAIMLLSGVLFSNKISEHQMDKNEIYNKAVKINSTELFQYGMNTNIGNAFVYGDLEAVDTVTYPEIGGKFMYVKKVKEKYTKHTRRVPHTRTVNGKTTTYYTTETYWTWDRVSSEDIICKQISFCNIVFDSSKFKLPDVEYIDTIKQSSHVRYKYYGCKVKYTGTVFASLKNKTINNTKFYNKKNIEETVDYLESDTSIIFFWVIWVILIICCVYGFFYIDNEWLEN